MKTYHYVTLEYRRARAQEDIMALMEEWGRSGWRLAFVLESERVLVLERVE